jgi:hypothetical protein
LLSRGQGRKAHFGQDGLELRASGVATLDPERKNGLENGNDHLGFGEVPAFRPYGKPAFDIPRVAAIDLAFPDLFA